MFLFNDLINSEYFHFLLILFVSLAVARIFLFILKEYIKKITEKTKTDLDDIILKIITKPLHILFVFAGLYFALKSLSVLNSYALLLDKIFFISWVLIVAMIVSKILSVLINRWFRVKKRYEKTPQLINKIAAIIIYLIAVLIILSHFKIEITPLVATLGLGGLAVGLALQNTLSNFFAGLHIISDSPVSVGDFIEIEGGISGFVEDIGWRSTRIRTLPNNIVIIPNAKLAESVIINNSLPQKETGLVVQCGVDYGSDLEKVENVTLETAKKIQQTVAGGVKSFEPFVRYHTFADSNINFSVILRVEKFTDKYFIAHEFIKALKKRYDEEGIEISWPVRKIYQGGK